MSKQVDKQTNRTETYDCQSLTLEIKTIYLYKIDAKILESPISDDLRNLSKVHTCHTYCSMLPFLVHSKAPFSYMP